MSASLDRGPLRVAQAVHPGKYRLGEDISDSVAHRRILGGENWCDAGSGPDCISGDGKKGQSRKAKSVVVRSAKS